MKDDLHTIDPIPLKETIDIPRVIKYFADVLDRPDMQSKDSSVILNMGLHYIRSVSFRMGQNILDSFIREAQRHPAKVIWRGQTAVREKIDEKDFQRSFISYQVCYRKYYGIYKRY